MFRLALSEVRATGAVRYERYRKVLSVAGDPRGSWLGSQIVAVVTQKYS